MPVSWQAGPVLRLLSGPTLSIEYAASAAVGTSPAVNVKEDGGACCCTPLQGGGGVPCIAKLQEEDPQKFLTPFFRLNTLWRHGVGPI
jgi:hypothetical protein